MIRTCTEADWEYVTPERRPEGAPCGRTYEDVDHSTLCPHLPLPEKLDELALEQLARDLGIETPPSP